MPATVIKTAVGEESRLVQQADGYELQRTYIVDDCTGTLEAQLMDALSASGIPAFGAACTVTGLTDLRVVERTVEPLDRSGAKCRVTVIYRKPTEDQRPDPTNDDETPVKTITASLSSVKTNLDHAGNPIIVTHNGVPQGVEIEKQMPTIVMRYRRRETQRPFTRALNHVGKTNNSSFEGRPARTVLCTSITGESRDGGVTYDVDYEFQYLPETWDVQVFWIDKTTGRPPDNLVAGVGYKTVQVYPTANHAGLSL